MKINWFPGHMTKAVRMMEEAAKLVDCFVFVLDSRAIAASEADFSKLIKDKPALYIFNKADTVEKSDLALWEREFSAAGRRFVSTDGTNSKCKGAILKALGEINAEKIRKYAQKGVRKSVRAMVIGIPNSGKSTLANSLCGGKRAATGDKAGVTRGKQWVAVAEGVELLDTPGTLPPNLENQRHAEHLAFIGALNDDVLNVTELACALIGFLTENESDALFARYGETDGEPEAVLEQIAIKRGYIFKGGAPDCQRAARAVIDDFRKRRIGKIMLEKPELNDDRR